MQETLQFPQEGVYIYMLRGLNSYVWISLSWDLTARLEAISRGDVPFSLKGRTPVELVYVRRYPSLEEARAVMKTLKGYTRERKERLLASYAEAWQAATEKTAGTACQIGEQIDFPPARAAALCTVVSGKNNTFQAISAEIIAMSEADQAMRKSGVWDASVDVRNTARIRQIIAEIGWPTISKVGKQAAQMAWLLVQHAGHDRDFQRACLALMRAQPSGEVDARNIAYLEDRVRVGEGRPQLYGTQFHASDQGALEPFPIEDQDQVDARRAEVGLGTLADYTAGMRLRHSS